MARLRKGASWAQSSGWAIGSLGMALYKKLYMGTRWTLNQARMVRSLKQKSLKLRKAFQYDFFCFLRTAPVNNLSL